jgi:hypothetical protein
MDMETRLRRYFADRGPAPDFDVRVMGRIAGLRQVLGSRDERAVAAARRFARQRAELLSRQRETMLWLIASAALAVIIAFVLAPVTGASVPRIAALLGSEVAAGVSFGALLTLLPLVVWLSVRQPRMASRW